MKVAVHQPEYMPWLGLLDKARRADVLVLLDDVQFNGRSLQHRCKIAGPKGWRWLTIPFVHRGERQAIRDVQVADPAWPARHLALIEDGYKGAPAAGAVLPLLREFYAVRWERVVEAAVASMGMLSWACGVRPPGIATDTVLSSSLNAQGQKGDRVLDICRKVGATTYLSGRSGAAYLDRDAFAAAGIEIEVQQFTVPRYREGQPDEPGLSALDAWAWLGDRAREVLS